MQGRYGSMWIDKWRTGEVAQGGADAGVLNAMEVWAEELAGFADKPECVKYALEVASGNKFPPTCPEFLELCREYGRRKQQDLLKLGHTLTEEERETQKAFAEKLTATVTKKEESSMLGWALHPQSSHAASAIFQEAKAGNSVLGDIFAGHVVQGVMSEEGKLLKRWDRTQYVAT